MKVYRKLSLQDRCLIKIGIDNRESPGKIAKKMERNRSVIKKEINKNGGSLWYDPIKAHYRASISNKIGYSKISQNEALKNYIISKLKIDWSPVIIAGRWCMENDSVKITSESIYTWIYSDEMKGEKLFSYLSRRKKKRGMIVRKSINKDINKKSINSRPEEVNNRSRIGDWEADLVFQQGNQSANFLTAIERKTRFVAVIKHESKNSEGVTFTIKKLEKEHGIKTLTLDNGSEFSKWGEYATDTFFCDPGSPWQKGAIEQFNGMLRRKIDYRVPMNEISQNFIDKIVDDLNNTPRKVLGFLTPNEALKESRMKIAQPAIEAFQ